MKIIIGIATNRKYLRYSLSMIASVYVNSRRKKDLEFNIFSRITENINNNDYKSLIRRYPNIKLRFHRINDDIIMNYPTNRHITVDAYLRLLMPTVLNESNKMIYLDTDLIVLSPIEELYSVNLSGKILGAVRDRGFEEIANQSPLFNSGVLLINCKDYRKQNYLAKLLRVAKKEYLYGHWFADQDALNYVFRSKWMMLDETWNYTTHDNYSNNNIFRKDIRIIHFTGGSYCKPDHILCDNIYKRYYYSYSLSSSILYIPAILSSKLKSILNVFGII